MTDSPDECFTVNIYYSGENGNARKFAEEMLARGIVDNIRRQEGNERYDYFFPMNDPETLLLIDRWRDQGALDAHHRSENMKIIAELRTKYRLKMRVEKYRPIIIARQTGGKHGK